MLTETQKQILYGAILGDSYVETSFCKKKARIRFDHSSKQIEYTKWKHQALIPYVFPIRERKILDKRTKKLYHKVRFDTHTLSLFLKFRKLFYFENIKRVPNCISSLLTSPLALTIWYLDDGGKKTDCNAFRLHTTCYSLTEVHLFKNTLKQNFAIKAAIHKQGKGYLLYIGSRNGEADKFCKIVKRVVSSKIPSMLYKFH